MPNWPSMVAEQLMLPKDFNRDGHINAANVGDAGAGEYQRLPSGIVTFQARPVID